MTLENYNSCVDLYSDGLYRFMIKQCRDIDLAKDFVQESFEKLWIQKDKVNFEKAKSWLFSTAYHKAIDFQRREKLKENHGDVRFEEHSQFRQYSDLKEVLNKALETLPDVQRTVITLRDYEGYSYEEIAEITGLNDGQVKVYIFRARKALRKFIGDPERLV